MVNDRINTSDGVTTALTRGPAVPALRPCPACSVETVDHHPIVDITTGEIITRRVICTNQQCRAVTEV